MAKVRKLEQLVKEAVTVVDQLASMEYGKLSAKAFITMALDRAEKTKEEIQKLENTLSEKYDQYPTSNSFIQKARKWIEQNTCRSVPTSVRKLNWIARTDEISAEISALGHGSFSLFAIAVMRAAKSNPKAFGQIEDWDDYWGRFKEYEVRKGELFREIEQSYLPTDLIFSDQGNGNVKATFALAPAVPIGVNCGEALVQEFRRMQQAV